MKVSKYLAAMIMFTIFTIFNIVLGSKLSLSNVYNIKISDRENISISDIESTAEKNNIIPFASACYRISLQEDNYIFYTSDKYYDVVWNKHLGIKPGIIKSLNGRLNTIESMSFDELDADINAKIGAETWYLIGDEENCQNMILDLKNVYGYNIKDYPAKIDLSIILSYSAFIIVLLLLLLYCYFDSSFEKKEISIRVVNGDSPIYHYFRISLIDTVVFSMLFGICVLIQYSYTQLMNAYTNVYLLFIPFIIAVWCVNIHILNIKTKEILYGHNISLKLMSMLSFVEKIVAVSCCVCVLLSVSTIPSLRKYQNAEELFQQNKDCAFMEYVFDLQTDKKMMEDDAFFAQQLSIMREFFKGSDKILQPMCICDITRNRYNMKNADWNAVYCNFRALSYLQNVIKEISEINIADYDMILLIPDNVSESEKQCITDFLSGQFNIFEGYTPETDRTTLINYTPENEVICFNSDYDSQFLFYDAPAICIASDTCSRNDIEKLNINHDKLGTGTIYNISDISEFDVLFQDKNFSPIVTNSYEKFKIDYKVQKAFLMLSVFISVLVTIFYAVVQYIILKLDYQVNALELSIKKTLGYSIWQRNHRHFINAFISGTLNIIVSLIFVKTGAFESFSVISVPLILIILNLILIYVLVRKIEKVKLAKILKGGAL